MENKEKFVKAEVEEITFEEDIITESGTVTPPQGPTGYDDF